MVDINRYSFKKFEHVGSTYEDIEYMVNSFSNSNDVGRFIVDGANLVIRIDLERDFGPNGESAVIPQFFDEEMNLILTDKIQALFTEHKEECENYYWVKELTNYLYDIVKERIE